MKRLLFSAVLSWSLLFSQISYGQDAEILEINNIRLRENLNLLVCAGVGSMVLSGDDGVLLVDPGYKEAAEILAQEIAGVNPDKVKFVINTHWHFDHVGGNYRFSHEAVLIAHPQVWELLSTGDSLLGSYIDPYPADQLPQLLVKDTLLIKMNNELICIISLPGGHTGGDLVVWFTKSGFVYIGDMIFADMFPFIDTDHGGNALQDADILDRLLKSMPDTVQYIPSHGRVLTSKDVRVYIDMLRSTCAIVGKSMKKYKTEELLGKSGILDEFKEWELSFTREEWIKMCRKSLLSEE